MFRTEKKIRGAGFEPAKLLAEDLQSPSFDHLDTPNNYVLGVRGLEPLRSKH